MTPKKIFVNDSVMMLNFKGVKFAMVSVSLTKLEDIEQYPYILESEHNRLVEELKAENEKLKEFAKLAKENLDDWVEVCPELYGAEDVEVLEAYEKLHIKDK